MEFSCDLAPEQEGIWPTGAVTYRFVGHIPPPGAAVQFHRHPCDGLPTGTPVFPAQHWVETRLDTHKFLCEFGHQGLSRHRTLGSGCSCFSGGQCECGAKEWNTGPGAMDTGDWSEAQEEGNGGWNWKSGSEIGK